MPQTEVLRHAPLAIRLQTLIDSFHKAHPKQNGPIVYALHTGYARLTEELFAHVKWPHPESQVFLMCDHSKILWSLAHPFFVFQDQRTHLRVPNTHSLALEKTKASRAAWRGRFEPAYTHLPRNALEAIRSTLHRFTSITLPKARVTDRLELLGNPRNAVTFVTNLDAGGAERQASLILNGLIERPTTRKTTAFHALTYSPGGAPPQEQFFGPSLKIEKTALHDITKIDLIRAPYLVAKALGKPYTWGAEVEEHLMHRLGDLDPSLANTVATFFWAMLPIRPRVVFCWQDYMNTVGGLAACLCGAQQIILGGRNVAPDVMGFHQPFFKDIYQTLLKDPRVEMRCNAHAGARSYAAWLERPLDQIKVIHNAFEPSARSSDAENIKELSAPTLLGVFKLRPEKDPELFLETVGLIRQKMPNLQVYHLGDGPLLEDFKASIQKRGMSDFVTVLGLRDDVPEWMQRADIMLHTALTEGLPNVFLEAQYEGLPIVTTKAGGTAEAMIPGITGDEITQRDPHILADRVLMRLDDTAWRANVRQAGPEFVQKNFSLESIIAQTIAGLDL